MNISDLIKDQYYTYNNNQYSFILKAYGRDAKADNIGTPVIKGYSNHFCMEGYFNSCTGFKPATQQQINWLNACIKANKFIPESEVKSITPEYSIF